MAGEHLVIPEFVGHVPHMVANLKRLELIEWGQLDSNAAGEAGGTKFERAASTDSPFREMVAWAYLRVSGRPGMPDVDVDRWLCSISKHLAETGVR